MSGRIYADLGVLERGAQNFEHVLKEFEDVLDGLDDHLRVSLAEWTGDARRAYQAFHDTWRKDARELAERLAAAAGDRELPRQLQAIPRREPDDVEPLMGPPQVDITPETVDTAARNFATGQQDLIKAYTTLSQKLAAHSSGMAGFDKAARQFAALYDPAAKAAFQAFHKAIEALGGTSLGLTHTINNHVAADHHSRADHPGGPPPRYPAHPVTENFAVAAPPSVIGAMSWAPSITVPRIRNRFPQLPGWVDNLLGTSDDWPQGNDQMFDQTGDAWREAAEEVGRVASWLNWTITTILDPADNAEHTAVANYWASLYRPADPSTVISGLSMMCQALAGACHEYAHAIREVTDVVIVEDIAEIVLALAGGAIAARLLRGTLGRLLRRLLGRAAAHMARAVTGIATRSGIRDLLSKLFKAIADTKLVRGVRVAFDETAGRLLGKDMLPEGVRRYGRGTIDERARKFDPDEAKLAEFLASEGKTVVARPEGDIRTADAFVDGTPTEFKTIMGAKIPGSAERELPTGNTVKGALNSAKGQFKGDPPGDRTAILDGREHGLTRDAAQEGLKRYLGQPHAKGRIDHIRIVGDGWEINWP